LSRGVVRVLRRLADIVVWQGPAGLATQVLALAGVRILHWYVLPSLRDAAPVESELPLAIAPLDAAESPAYLDFRRGATAEQFRSRFARGCQCYVARLDGAIVSATWIATGRGRIEAFDFDFELGPKQIYVFDSFTLPAYRGQRIIGAVTSCWRADYLQRGFEQVLSLTGPENQASRRSRRRSGFRRTGGIVRIKLGPWQRCFSWGCREL
jgi:hypothetical protein